MLRPHGVPAAQAGLLSVAAATAGAEATAALSGVAVTVKWPNDLLVSGRKIGGVLVETGIAGARIAWAVVGVGINANLGVEAFPPRLRRSATTLLSETRREISLDALLSRLCAQLEGLLRMIEAGQTDQIIERWRAVDSTPGRSVRARDNGWTGVASGVDAAGQLLVTTGDGRLITLPTSSGIIIE